MRKLFIIFGFLALTMTGCAKDNLSPRDNVSPKLQQDINNQNGKIERLENNQNSLRAEIDKISLINKENSGIQILQGDGPLILIFGLGTMFLVCSYFYKVSENYKKSAAIMAQEISDYNDPELEQNILKAAKHTDVEDKVFKLMMRK